jgi:hypothetical protein
LKGGRGSVGSVGSALIPQISPRKVASARLRKTAFMGRPARTVLGREREAGTHSSAMQAYIGQPYYKTETSDAAGIDEWDFLTLLRAPNALVSLHRAAIQAHRVVPKSMPYIMVVFVTSLDCPGKASGWYKVGCMQACPYLIRIRSPR